jgi:hypothetical protein
MPFVRSITSMHSFALFSQLLSEQHPFLGPTSITPAIRRNILTTGARILSSNIGDKVVLS